MVKAVILYTRNMEWRKWNTTATGWTAFEQNQGQQITVDWADHFGSWSCCWVIRKRLYNKISERITWSSWIQYCAIEQEIIGNNVTEKRQRLQSFYRMSAENTTGPRCSIVVDWKYRFNNSLVFLCNGTFAQFDCWSTCCCVSVLPSPLLSYGSDWLHFGKYALT